jgi:hypothetical protein
MKILFFILLIAGSAAASDVRIIDGREVDLAPIYQWQETNGPATSRPLSAWRAVQVLQVGEPVSVYTQCNIAVDGITNMVLVDHLPPEIKKFITQRNQVETNIQTLQTNILSETKRLRIVTAESANWDVGSAAYQKFLLDRAALDNNRQTINELRQQRAELKSQEPGATTDFAIQMNKRYLNLDIWDFGIKPGKTPPGGQ